MTRLLHEERKTVAMLTQELAMWRQSQDGDEKEDEDEGHDEAFALPPPPYDPVDHSSPIARRIRDNEEIATLMAANAQLQQGNWDNPRPLETPPALRSSVSFHF